MLDWVVLYIVGPPNEVGGAKLIHLADVDFSGMPWFNHFSVEKGAMMPAVWSRGRENEIRLHSQHTDFKITIKIMPSMLGCRDIASWIGHHGALEAMVTPEHRKDFVFVEVERESARSNLDKLPHLISSSIIRAPWNRSPFFSTPAARLEKRFRQMMT